MTIKKQFFYRRAFKKKKNQRYIWKCNYSFLQSERLTAAAIVPYHLTYAMQYIRTQTIYGLFWCWVFCLFCSKGEVALVVYSKFFIWICRVLGLLDSVRMDTRRRTYKIAPMSMYVVHTHVRIMYPFSKTLICTLQH